MFVDEVRNTLYFDMFELRTEIKLQLRFFAPHCDVFLLRHSYVIYLFNIVTFFDNVRITLQLRFIFARHCDVFFITSQLRYSFVRCSCVF